MAEILCKPPRHQAPPKVDVETFDGISLSFQYFMTVFKEEVESKIDDSRGRSKTVGKKMYSSSL